MILTKKEKILIERLRADEISQKPIKVGFLKENLYSSNLNNNYASLSSIFEMSKKYDEPCSVFTYKEKEKIIAEFSKKFELVLPANTKFVCYFDDGYDLWYDAVNYGLEGMSSQWAVKHLKNIVKAK